MFQRHRLRKRSVANRLDGFSTNLATPRTVEQRPQDARGVHTANVGDLGTGDRLLVGDDGQRLERGDGELLRRALVKESPYPLVKLGARDDLIAARDLDHLQAAGPVVLALQLLDGGDDFFLRLVVEQFDQRLHRHRLG